MLTTVRQAMKSSNRIGNPLRFQPTSVVGFLLVSLVLSKYPTTTTPVVTSSVLEFKVGVISDDDENSVSTKENNTWVSVYLTGTLKWNNNTRNMTIQWDKANNKTVKSKFSYGGRGMELSELITFNGKLLTFDDRTGLIYILKDGKVYPWVVLADGDGNNTKGFKSEWATEKNGTLYVGSSGKEWTSKNGSIENHNPMWVKMINKNGSVISVNWTNNYENIRKTVNITFPGYMWHEAGCWSVKHSKWFFLPRRMSSESFNNTKFETQGANIIIKCGTNFTCEHTKIEANESDTDNNNERGFSSFKFLPNTEDEIIVALKTVEHGNKTETYITSFYVNGTVLLKDEKIDNHKYEGIDFINEITNNVNSGAKV